MSSWLEQEVLRLAVAIKRERAHEQVIDAANRYPGLTAEVRAYLDEHPGATANAVARELRRRKQDVHLVMRSLRDPVPWNEAAA